MGHLTPSAKIGRPSQYCRQGQNLLDGDQEQMTERRSTSQQHVGEGQGPRARVWSTIEEGVIRKLVDDPGESTLTKWEINILESNPLRFTCSFGKGSYTMRKMYRRDRGVLRMPQMREFD